MLKTKIAANVGLAYREQSKNSSNAF
jgi:hypothetical protein